ncbi:MAG: ATP-binding protein [Pseudomonadota bacterium]
MSTRITREFKTCRVSDTGIGIPKDKTNKIFEKFFRVDNSDTYEIEGTEPGLSIVKHIISSHNGKIIVDSILGNGSVFTFYLPLEMERMGSVADQ